MCNGLNIVIKVQASLNTFVKGHNYNGFRK